MFDLEIVMPISAKGKYGLRIKDFKKTGLLNVGKNKILLSLLVGNEEISDILDGWPDGVEVRIMHSELNHPAAKVYYYYSLYLPLNYRPAKWHAKIDDDTANDISALLKELESYDSTNKLYLTARLDHIIEKTEKNLLTQFGRGSWIDGTKPLWHEVEGCILSASSIEAIMCSEEATKFMWQRAQIESGFTDVSLACAARMCGIYPIDAPFMSQYGLVGKFTVFNGPLSHVHFITPYTAKIIENKINNIQLDKNICGVKYIFASNIKPLSILILQEDGCIQGSTHKNEYMWFIENNNLIFLDQSGNPTTIFKNYSKDYSLIKGNFCKNGSELNLKLM